MCWVIIYYPNYFYFNMEFDKWNDIYQKKRENENEIR